MREKATLEEEASNLRHQTEEGGRIATELHQRLQSQGSLIASLQDQVQALQDALQQANNELGLQGKQSDDMKWVFSFSLVARKVVGKVVGDVGVKGGS